MTESGHGAVAVHRWFAGGEGWACHPWFAGHEREWVTALEGPLRGPLGEFTVPFRNGALIGEKISDPDCPDPKALGRHPFILRTAFLAVAEPTDSHRFEALQHLRELPLPAQPGHLAGLFLRELAAPAMSNSLSRALLILVGFGMICLIGFVGVLLLVLDTSRDSGVRPVSVPPSSKAAPPTALKPVDPNEVPAPLPVADDLRPDSAGEVPYLNDRTQVEFRRQAGRGAGYDHPYIAFLNTAAERLPEVATKCSTAEDVQAGMRRLLKHLRSGQVTDGMSLEAMRAAIDAELDYDAWRRGPGQKDYADRLKPLPEELRRHVEKFRRPGPELEAICRRLGELLREWNDPDADDPRPLTRIDTFFHRLTRPANWPKMDHPRVAFLRRLPLEPVAEGQTFDDTEDLARALRHLLYLLDPTYRLDPLPARELLERIAVQMQYSTWRAAHSREHFRDERMTLEASVERAVQRFD